MSEANHDKDKIAFNKTSADAPSESPCAPIPYSIFSATQRRIITSLLCAACLISPLTATIYLPLIPPLAAHFSISIQATNLTITLYIIFQALAPLLISVHADTLGRRPVYLVAFLLYTVASLGLALNRSSYAALLTLRAVQSLGASSVLSVCYGTVADISPSSGRGKILGPVMASSNLGTAIGPVVGGWIAYSASGIWWAFWALVIFGGSMFAALVLFMPETARNVVGNGSVKERSWNRSLLDLWTGKHSNQMPDGEAQPKGSAPGPHQADHPQRKFNFKSPLSSIRMMFEPDTALILWLVGSFYALWYAVQASIPLALGTEPYSLNELHIGLAYLPGAFGVIVCMYLTGKVMDHNYRVITTRHKASRPPTRGDGGNSNGINNDNDDTFPIERARSRFTGHLLLLSLAITIGYGWSLQFHAPLAVPLVLQALTGFLATWITNVFNALLVDGHPHAPSAAATAGNLVRCGFSAGLVAALQPLSRAIGRGWFFTAVGVLSGVVGLVAVLVLDRKGTGWRVDRLRRRKAKEEQSCDVRRG